MSRNLLFVLAVAACGNGAKSSADQQKAPQGPVEKIAVPGSPGKAAGASGDAVVPAASPDDPKFHLKPEEGTITVDKGQAKAGSPATAALKLAPGAGYHVATDFPIKVTLEAPAGVKLDKTELTAGGRNKAKGDAQTFSEQALAFAIKATPEKPGSYEIKGVFKFGICEKDSCHPKKQPITLTVAAN